MTAARMPEHTAIRASAGSGKTFVLSQRFIELLARGAPVERITALTFSRKAAREIFDSVIRYLCEAARSETGARERSAQTGVDLSRREYGSVLSRLLSDLHLLRVGTIDSFITGILRLFPEHFGIAPDFALFDSSGDEARRVHGKVLARILKGDEARKEAFAAAFSAATAGRHEKGLGRILERELMGSQELYRAVPDCLRWAVSSAPPSPSAKGGIDPAAAAEGILSDEYVRSLPDKTRRRWEDFARAAAGWKPGSRWSRELEYLFVKLTEVREDLLHGDAEVSLDRRKVEVGGLLRENALALVAHVVASEAEAAAIRTQGLCRLLEHYEEEYDRFVRKAGRFSFTDAVEFVAGGGALPSSLRERGGGRLYVEYRLDARLDHWLLDEFQDTSRRQWDVFANMADEVLQDGDGGRSFFVVGDAKQAIYGWRGGDARLLAELMERYDGQMRNRDLAQSYRSASPVIETVNGIFGGSGIEALPRRTVAAWRELWVEHTAAEGCVPAAGVAMVVEPAAGEGTKPSAEDRYAVAAAILEETVGRAAGLTAAILVRKNARVQEIGEYLRRTCPSVPVECDGPAAIFDSAAVGVLISMVRCAFHPGDSAALRHVLMSPVGPEVERLARRPAGMTGELLGEIRKVGYAAFVTRWGKVLDEKADLGDFERMRLGQLRAAALRFSSRGGTEGDDFCAYVEGLRLREEGASARVRIMTVHQSKGLDFDLVILPDLNDWGAMDRARAGELATAAGGSPSGDVILRLPRRVVAAWDGDLAEAVRQSDAASALEELSLLYVACTRARAGLYVVTSFPGRSSRALTPAALVMKALCGGDEDKRETVSLGKGSFQVKYLKGDPAWHLRLEGGAPETAAASPVDAGGELRIPVPQALTRTMPSASEENVFDAQWLFDDSSRRALQTGAAVHGLFEGVSWTEEAVIDDVVTEWRKSASCPAPVIRDAEEHFRRSLARDAVRNALAHEGRSCDLWREKSFDVVTEGEWLSGVFDRVEIMYGSSGEVSWARITDFKSDRVDSRAGLEKAVGRYGRQMELYRRALAALIGVDASAIVTRLVFTGPGIVCDGVSGAAGRDMAIRGAPWQDAGGGSE